MRTTVGPLPSAVYWRRRAVVLGALLLGVIVLFVSCTGGGDDGKPGGSAASPTPSAGAPGSQPTDDPSFGTAPPGANNPLLPDPEDLQSGGPQGAVPSAGAPGGPGASGAPGDGSSAGAGNGTGTGTTTGGGTDTNVGVPADGSCTDAEIALTPIPATPTVKRGETVTVRLKVKNVSTRTCARDVGADLQEIYVESGAQKIWSSDTCGTASGSDVQQFAPSGEQEFNVAWNGRESSKCTSGLAAGESPVAGQYQVRARLGGKVSEPVTITLS